MATTTAVRENAARVWEAGSEELYQMPDGTWYLIRLNWWRAKPRPELLLDDEAAEWLLTQENREDGN